MTNLAGQDADATNFLKLKNRSRLRNFLDNRHKELRGLSQITFALRVGRWSENRVVYYIKSANSGRTWSKNSKKCKRNL